MWLALSCGETTVALLTLLSGSVGLIGVVVVELAPPLPSASRLLETPPTLVVVEDVPPTLSPLPLDVEEGNTWPSLPASPGGSGKGPSTPATVAALVDSETDTDVTPSAKIKDRDFFDKRTSY